MSKRTTKKAEHEAIPSVEEIQRLMNLRYGQKDEPEESSISGCPDVYHVITELWKRASNELSENELKWFVNCGEQARFLISNLADTTETIGLYLAESDSNEGLSEGRVSTLLYFLSESMMAVNALMSVGDSANYQLLCMKEAMLNETMDEAEMYRLKEMAVTAPASA